MLDLARLQAAYEKSKSDLLAERTPDGHWVGELSSSALSTATAVSALAMVAGRRSNVECREDDDPTFDLRPSTFDNLIARGVAYLAAQQNTDGGFGDTDLSHSNIATTYLVVAALHLAGVADQHAALLERADAYLESKGRLDGLRKRYGIDKTFVVPIMTNLALAGLVEWKEIDPLPFELACVPQSWYRFVGMPVVSYAIPALVAIGQARYFHAPPRNLLKRLIRWLSITRSLKVLRAMQPGSGGYLEATPLTAFVVMSLAGLVESRKSKVEGQSPTFDLRPSTFDNTRCHPVAGEVIANGVNFLIHSIRPDGSWPIDTNLATWNTTLAINALAGAGEDVAELLGVSAVGNVLDWLLACQHRKRHPFTGADPGGFGWTDLSGAVPDADDTPGAILALQHLSDHIIDRRNALDWLLRLQNRDGGWPTFCRGWGKLPFDRSGTDLAAHVLRAIMSFRIVQHPGSPPPGCHGDSFGLDRYLFVWDTIVEKPVARAQRFLSQRQHPNGSWSPLWFGNQDHPEEDNPVYGTAKVLMAYRDLGLMDSPEAKRGVAWLVGNQNADGGWGSGVWGKLRIADCGLRIAEPGRSAELGTQSGVESVGLVTGSGGSGHKTITAEGNPQSAIRNPQLVSSVEETALAVEALLAACPESPLTPDPQSPTPSAAVARGLAWLIDRVEAGQHRQPAPIGFYFAKLWYYERLYPLTFTVAALGRACRQFAYPIQPDSHTAPPRTAVPSDSRAP